jgi:hypothetical protein
MEQRVTTSLLATLMNPANQTAAVSIRKGISSSKAFLQIYSGSIYSTHASILNFNRGIREHFFKEGLRAFFKGVGVGLLLPYLETAMPKSDAALCFAATMSAAEFFVNPLDVGRTLKQSIPNLPKYNPLSQIGLSAVTLNVGRSGGTWYTWSRMDQLAEKWIHENTNIDPKSHLGIFLRSIMSNAVWSPTVQVLETLKVRFQLATVDHYKEVMHEPSSVSRLPSSFFEGAIDTPLSAKLAQSTMINILKDTVQAGGARALISGWAAKGIYNWFLSIGVTYNKELGAKGKWIHEAPAFKMK